MRKFIIAIAALAVCATAAAPTWTSGVSYQLSEEVQLGLADTLASVDTVLAFTSWRCNYDYEMIFGSPAFVAASKDTAVVAIYAKRYDAKGNLISAAVVDSLDKAGGYISIPNTGETTISLYLVSSNNGKVRVPYCTLVGRRVLTNMLTVK